MKVIVLDLPQQIGNSDTYRGQFYSERYRRIACGHPIPQPGRDKAGHRRRDRHCRNDATFMRWVNGLWAHPRCTMHESVTPSIKQLLRGEQ